MADSIVSSLSESLSDTSKQILQSIVDFVSGPAAVVDLGSTKAVFGTGTDGNTKGLVVASDAAVTGNINDANFALSVELPAAVGLVFQGPATNVSATEASNYFQSLIDTALPADSKDTAVIEKRASLEEAVQLVTASQESKAAVRVVGIKSDATTTSDSSKVVLTGANAAAGEVIAVNTAGLGAKQQLVLENMERVVIVHGADVAISGSKASFVAGDNADQKVTGGSGADTLVGGGGNDTLIGGVGADAFGVVGSGTLTLGDFSGSSGDRLKFNIDGVTTIAQLKALITNVQEDANGLTIAFNTGMTISLVGLKNSDLTADMVDLTIS